MDEQEAQPREPTVLESWSVIVQVCAAFQGNLSEHQAVQHALGQVSAELVTAGAIPPPPNRAARRAAKRPVKKKGAVPANARAR